MVGRLTHLPVPGAVRAYAALLRVDLTEVDGELRDFPSIHAFFIRSLRPGVRPVERQPEHLVSPCDGTLNGMGDVPDHITVKGQTLDLNEFLGGGDQATRFQRGSYRSVYLSPRDYHRVHAPAEGPVLSSFRVPGALYPVNGIGLRFIPNLFVRNERSGLIFDDPMLGAVALVLVGATNVGSVVLEPKVGERLRRGAEVGRFELGSTVVVLTERPLVGGRLGPVRYGESVGRIMDSSSSSSG